MPNACKMLLSTLSLNLMLIELMVPSSQGIAHQQQKNVLSFSLYIPK